VFFVSLFCLPVRFPGRSLAYRAISANRPLPGQAGSERGNGLTVKTPRLFCLRAVAVSHSVTVSLTHCLAAGGNGCSLAGTERRRGSHFPVPTATEPQISAEDLGDGIIRSRESEP
jgi:hypothetical protein